MSDADNLEIKKRARRRLVGAAALALAAAIVLPMMMEQEPHPGSPDIQVVIPDRDGASSGRALSGDAASADASVAPAPVEEPPQNLAASPAPAVPTPQPQAHAEESAPKPVPAPLAPPRAAAADEAARVRSLLEGKPVAAAPPAREAATKESFVLQIGAFGDVAKADSISSELKQAGFSAYTEKAGAMTRVRVGPFSSRDEAEKAAARLKAQGRNAVLTPR